jgi:GrpB-like predicted nucleotidyltransferase (UPF0157 family)
MSPRLGLPDDVVQLTPYSTQWKWLFRWERLRLWLQLGSAIQAVHHVGSTAIPGMPAKPIIDIIVVVADFERAERCIPVIERLGYEYKGENDQLRQRYFVKGYPTTHTLFVVEPHSQELAAKVCFRDYLTQHAELAQAYADLKRRLAREFATDRQAFQDAKAPFVQQVLQTAELDNCARQEDSQIPGNVIGPDT